MMLASSYASFALGLLVGFGAGLVLCGIILRNFETRVRELEKRS